MSDYIGYDYADYMGFDRAFPGRDYSRRIMFDPYTGRPVMFDPYTGRHVAVNTAEERFYRESQAELYDELRAEFKRWINQRAEKEEPEIDFNSPEWTELEL